MSTDYKVYIGPYIKIQSKKVLDYDDSYDESIEALREMMNHSHYGCGFIYLIPNVSFDGSCWRFDPRYEHQECELFPSMVDSSKEKFKEKFKNEIECLNKKFGADNVTLKFGVLNDWT